MKRENLTTSLVSTIFKVIKNFADRTLLIHAKDTAQQTTTIICIIFNIVQKFNQIKSKNGSQFHYQCLHLSDRITHEKQ